MYMYVTRYPSIIIDKRYKWRTQYHRVVLKKFRRFEKYKLFSITVLHLHRNTQYDCKYAVKEVH